MSVLVENDQSEQITHDSSTAKKINKLFNSSKTRHDGWRLLNSFLPHCPDEFLLQSCVSWMQNCCKIDGSDKHKEYAITLLGNLFKISKNYQELKKSVSFFITTQYFDFFFKYFLNSKPGWECTKNCLLFYRGACGAFQDSLQKHLTEEISKSTKIPVNVAECFALIPCTGGGGNDSINYKRNWRSQFLKFLSICHSILNDLYDDAEELRFQEYETLEHTYRHPEKSKSTAYLVTQLYNHITVLNCMLLNQYPAPKSIPPDLIFQLLCRGLALSPKSLEGRRTTKLIALQEVLPHVHCVFLSLLKAALVSCKNLLYPYSHLVCKLIKQVLDWTDADGYRGEESVVELRVSAYETLCNWLAVARNGSCVEGIAGAVISSAASDVVAKKAVVFLKAKHQSKDQMQARRVDTTPDTRLCYPALKCLQFLLKFAGVSLKSEEHKFLQEMVVELLMEVQKTPTGDVPPPFDSPRCRKELYSVLLELVHQPCSKWSPPTQFALELFSKGVNDGSPEISSFCSAALNFTTIIIHPEYDNGDFSTREKSDGGEPKIRWTEEPLEDGGGGGDGSEENVIEKNGDAASIVPAEKLSAASEELVFSNSEDSRATIPYSEEVEGGENVSEAVMEVGDEQDEERVDALDSVEVVEEPEEMEEVKELKEEEEVEKMEEVRETQKTEEAEEEPLPKKRKISETSEVETSVEEHSKTQPTIEENKEKDDQAENSEPPHLTPESLTPAENHPKKRYFLRSKRKGAAEWGEEGVKSGSSPDSGKSTPLKGMAQSTPLVYTPTRRSTRALSRSRTYCELEPKAHDRNGHDDDIDEENLKAAFDDSLAD